MSAIDKYPAAISCLSDKSPREPWARVRIYFKPSDTASLRAGVLPGRSCMARSKVNSSLFEISRTWLKCSRVRACSIRKDTTQPPAITANSAAQASANRFRLANLRAR